MQTAATIEIKRSIEDVFAYISDLEHMEAWVAGVEDVRLVSGEPGTEGARYESAYTYGGKTHEMSYQVTGVEPPRYFGMRGEGPFPFEAELQLEPTPEGTQVTNVLDAGADSRFTAVMFGLFGPVLRWVMRRRLAAELDELRAAIEIEEQPATV